MPPLKSLHVALWAAYALTVVVHVGALLAQAGPLSRATQPLFAPLLLVILVAAAPHRSRMVTLMSAGLVSAWVGDTAGQLLPGLAKEAAAVAFFVALICYTAAMVPIWARARDPLRIMLAIPYGAVVIGLFVACADNAGKLLPLVLVYAVALGVMSFFSAGVNALTWMGGTLFLLSSSLLAVSWFLPGAALPLADELVMLSYAAGHGMLVSGMIRTMPRHRWEDRSASGAALVIVES